MSYQEYKDKLSKEYDQRTQAALREIGLGRLISLFPDARTQIYQHSQSPLASVMFRCVDDPQEATENMQELIDGEHDQQKKAYFRAQLQELRANLEGEN